MQTYTLDVRPRRQTTIPKSLLQQVGIDVGDKLIATVEEQKIILKPQKQVVLNTLKELQRLVKKSSITLKETQKNLKRIRKNIYAQRYS